MLSMPPDVRAGRRKTGAAEALNAEPNGRELTAGENTPGQPANISDPPDPDATMVVPGRICVPPVQRPMLVATRRKYSPRALTRMCW